MAPFDFTVAGGAGAVSTIKFEVLPCPGQIQTATNTNADELYYGGCGYNVFYALCKLGCRPYPVLTHELPLLCYESITELFTRAKAHVIVTTLVGEGSLIYEKTPQGVRSIRVPITHPPAGCMDMVGAGDGFVAGFLYRLSHGKALEDCAQYGSTVSSFVIERDGSTTNLPTAEEMLARNLLRPDACD